MTRREYVEAALLGRRLDRVPCFPLVDVVYAGAHCRVPLARIQLDPVAHAAALASCAAELPIDGVYVNLCLGSAQAARAVCRNGRWSTRIDGALDVEFAENDVAAIARTDIHDLDDPRIERAELFHPGMLETFKAVPANTRREVAVCAGLTGAFSQLGFLLGLENLLLALVDRPEAVHQALRRRQAIALRQAAELLGAGARFIWIGEGMASASLISPRTYSEFVLPYEQELADEIRGLGGLSILHICGNITPSLSAIAQSRVDGADIDAPTDWDAAVRVLGSRMCLKGNVNPLCFLPENMGSLAKVCESVLCDSARGRGFILSTGCLVPRDASRTAFTVMANMCYAEHAEPEAAKGSGHVS